MADAQAVLSVVTGSAVPDTIELKPGDMVTLGRSRRNKVVVSDELASAEHASIYNDGGRWFLVNKGRNGTRIDGRPLDLANPVGELHHLTEVRIGATVFKFSADYGSGLDFTPDQPIDATVVVADELQVFRRFIDKTATRTELEPLLLEALDLIRLQTRADLVGYLGADPDSVIPRVIVPKTGRIDVPLSRSVTAKAREERRTVHLASERDIIHSVVEMKDLVCVPLLAGDDFSGTLHVYSRRKEFTPREVQLCELLGALLAQRVQALLDRSRLASTAGETRGPKPATKLIGESDVVRGLRDRVRKFAQNRFSVLLLGESGTGKEVVARMLHELSPRARRPFECMHCAATPRELFESETFGHVKNAFNGAREHLGFFKRCDGGTLLLDEIGDAPLDAQVKLLRVIETGRFHPVGGDKELHADVRLIAATNVNLEKAVEAKLFRQDLLYRLKVVSIVLPPLREHAEDIPALATHFQDEWDIPAEARLRFGPGAMETLRAYHWPGNVRELKNVLQRLLCMYEGTAVGPREVRESFDESTAGAEPGEPPIDLDRLEKWGIERVFSRVGNNMTKAAALLGINRDTLYRKVKHHGIERPE